MLANLARGMTLVVLGLLIVAYVFSGERRAPEPPVPDDQIVGYYNA